jgi:hypothetical protein
MCLKIVDETPKKVKYAWKVVVIASRNRVGEPYRRRLAAPEKAYQYNPTDWNIASYRSIILADSGQLYTSGFHSWLTRRAARASYKSIQEYDEHDKYAVKKVEVDDIVASGTQIAIINGEQEPVVVSRKIKFVKG